MMTLTKYRPIVFILAAGGLLTLVMIFLASQPGRAAGPWYVAPGGDDSNDCLSPATPCATINGAIAKAGSGDMIYVAIGTYTDSGDEVMLLDKDVIVSGGWDGAFATQSGTSIIDCEESRRGIRVNSGVTTTIDRFAVQNGVASFGGGIRNYGTLTLNDSAVSGNRITVWQGGGIYNWGMLTLNNSAISGNTGSNGGGIYGGTVILNDSVVSGNTGVGIQSSTVTMTNSSVSGNIGGGISLSTVSGRNSTISGNVGSGIYNHGDTVLTLIDSTVSGNTDRGIYNDSGTVTITNSTVSGNTGTTGGGIYNFTGVLVLTNSTVSGNTARSAGGIYNDDYHGGTVTLQNTILAGNTASQYSPDCGGAIGSSGHNLIGDTADCAFSVSTGDILNVDAGLVPVADLLGFVPLLPDSPAIDAVPLGVCSLSTDQRGVVRPQGAACDIGAYEYSIPGPAAGIHAFRGTPQRSPPFFDFQTSLQALVLDSIGSPVDSLTVTFSAPASGASGTFVDSGTFTTTAATDGGGIATAATFTANGLEGSYTVTATVGGVMTPANFLLTNFGWYASPTGSDVNDCQTPATPCATIHGPLEKPGFAAGDTVLVATGTYTGTSGEVVLLDQDVRLSGGWDADFGVQDGVSIVDGEGARRGVWVNSGVTAMIERFTMQDGWADSNGGGGIFNQGTLTLNSCTVSGNTGSGIRSGLYGPANLTLNNCTVSRNTGDNGGGIDNGGMLTVNSTAINGNEVPGLGGGIHNSGIAILNNSTVGGNAADQGGGVRNSGTAVLNNSTVSGNTAWWGGGIYNDGGTATLQNTILAGNTASYAGPDCSGTIGSSGYNITGDTADCTFSATTGDMLDVDAGLIPLAGLLGYFPLHPDSLAIDAVPLVQCTLATDQRGVARPQGLACDIGAYEYNVPGPAASIHAFGGTPQRTAPFTTFEMPFEALVLDSIGSPVQGAIVDFSAPVSGASGTFADSGTYTTTAATDGGGVATAAAFTANGLEGSYMVTATVGGVDTPAPFLLTSIRWYVAPGGDDANDCQTAATPCATVNGVLGKPGFVGGDTVVVAIGIYTGTGDEVVLLDKDATISGGWDETFTAQEGMSIIDGGGVREGVRVNGDVIAVIERFAIQNGSTGIYNTGTLTLSSSAISGNTGGYGGGICNGGSGIPAHGTLTINNSTVSGNTASDGGGIYNGDILILNNSTVNGNTANDAGGIYNQGALSLTNSAVSGNTAGWGRGGGILNGGTLTLDNSTVSGNSAQEGGGISNYATVALHSSTVSGNMAQEGGGIRNYNTLTLANSILANNTAASAGPDCHGTVSSSGYNLIEDTTDCNFTVTTGDLIDVDARLFRLIGPPGYHPLRPGSPAIDAGNPAGCTDHLGNPLTTDQRGTPRPLDGDGDGNAICDMGAYEVDPEHPIRELFLPVILRNY